MPGDQGQRTQGLDGVAQRAAPGHEPDRADVTRGQRGGEEGCGGPAEVDGELLGARDGVHDVYVPQAVGAAEPLLQLAVEFGGHGDGAAHDLQAVGVRQQARDPRLGEPQALGDLGLAQAARVVEPRHLRDETQPVHVQPVLDHPHTSTP